MQFWFSLVLCLTGLPATLLAQVDDNPIMPKRLEATALIRSTLVTLNDANLTANYAVLRSLSAPDFQARFSSEYLASFFQGMRGKGIDLSTALLQEPVIERARFHTGQKVLQVGGTLDMTPVPLRFIFSYQSIDGRWRIYGLALDFDGEAQEPKSLTPSS